MGHKKIPGLKRINLTLDPEAIVGIDWLVSLDVTASRSRMVRELIAAEVSRQMMKGSTRRPRNAVR